MQESVKINRNYYIGGSDIPAIMGISKFKSRFEILRQKADLEEDTFTGNKYTEYGNTLEPKIRGYLNRQWQEKFEESIHVKDPSDFDFPIRCHLDGESEKSVLEIKTTGEDLIDLVKNESDDVVLRSTFKIYLVQTLFYMMNADKKVGCIAVYFRPKDLNEEFEFSRLRCFWFNIKEYEDIVEEITNSIKMFVADVQKLKKNPFLSEEDFMPMDLKVIAKNLLYFDDVIRQYKKQLEEFDLLKAKMLQAMIDHNIESFRTENGTLISAVAGTEPTEVIEKVFDIDQFTADHPKLAKKYTTEQVKLRAGRKGYIRITEPKEKKL